jgi:hypothetical protein
MRPFRFAVCLPLAVLSCAAPPPAPTPVAAVPPPAVTPPAPAPSATDASATIPRPRRPRVAMEVDPAAPTPAASICRTPSRYGNSARGMRDVMRVSGDGGWCRRNMVLLYEQTVAAPYLGMDVIEPPAHGEVQIHTLSSETVVYYRATPGYVGRDHFVLQAQPTYGRTVVNVRVLPAATSESR